MSTVSEAALAALAKIEEVKERNRLYAQRRRQEFKQAAAERDDLTSAVVGLTSQLSRLQDANENLIRQLDGHHCRGCRCIGRVDGPDECSTRPDESASISFSLDRLADYKSEEESVFDNAALSPLAINRAPDRVPDRVADVATQPSRASVANRVSRPRRSTRRGVKRLSLG